jgi:type I restriction enzyme S subunit
VEGHYQPKYGYFKNIKIDRKIFLFLCSDEGQKLISLSASQTGVPMISQEQILNFKIRLPINYDQLSKIAHILSTCDTVIEKTQAAIDKYKAIKQGMLQDLFTRGVDIYTGRLRPKYEDAPELYKESKLGMIPWEWSVENLGNENYFNFENRWNTINFN